LRSEDPREEVKVAQTNPDQIAAIRVLLKKKLKALPHRPFGVFKDAPTRLGASPTPGKKAGGEKGRERKADRALGATLGN